MGTRRIRGEVAHEAPGDVWVTTSGRRYYFCAGASCPGYHWRASDIPHPNTCVRELERSSGGVGRLTLRALYERFASVVVAARTVMDGAAEYLAPDDGRRDAQLEPGANLQGAREVEANREHVLRLGRELEALRRLGPSPLSEAAGMLSTIAVTHVADRSATAEQGESLLRAARVLYALADVDPDAQGLGEMLCVLGDASKLEPGQFQAYCEAKLAALLDRKAQRFCDVMGRQCAPSPCPGCTTTVKE